MEEEDLIKCPVCLKTGHVFEREEPVYIIKNLLWGDDKVEECKYFCGYCRIDFNILTLKNK